MIANLGQNSLLSSKSIQPQPSTILWSYFHVSRKKNSSNFFDTQKESLLLQKLGIPFWEKHILHHTVLSKHLLSARDQEALAPDEWCSCGSYEVPNHVTRGQESQRPFSAHRALFSQALDTGLWIWHYTDSAQRGFHHQVWRETREIA